MDYCTLFPEGWWSHCCELHDAGYAAQIGQALADAELAACVAGSLPQIAAENPLLAGVAAVTSTAIGGVMWLGVRLFGRRFYRNANKD